MSRIIVSEKHGVNPSMLVCPICHCSTNSLALVGKLPGDKEAPRHMIDREPCKECEEMMSKGILLVECRSDQSRTGLKWVVSREAVKRVFDDAHATLALKAGAAMISEDAVDGLGLPRVERKEDGKEGLE